MKALFSELEEELKTENQRTSFLFERIQEKRWNHFTVCVFHRTKLQVKLQTGAQACKNQCHWTDLYLNWQRGSKDGLFQRQDHNYLCFVSQTDILG